MKLSDLIKTLETRLPLALQEPWDCSGLNVGSRRQEITNVLFSYDPTPEALQAAVKLGCELIVTHHPVRLKGSPTLDLDKPTERFLGDCARAGVAVYACHTQHDSSPDSLNFHYLQKLGLKKIHPLDPRPSPHRGFPKNRCGLGAIGEWAKAKPIGDVLNDLKNIFALSWLRFVDGGKNKIKTVGICTGSGASYLPMATDLGLDLFITGDVKYHGALDAKNSGLSVVDVGHFASERESVVVLKNIFEELFGRRLRSHLFDQARDPFELV